jgi:ABC-type lipoprotein release transport system permease subunit
MGLASLRMPRRFLRGSYGGLALTAMALASGVALVCAIDLVNRAVEPRLPRDHRHHGGSRVAPGERRRARAHAEEIAETIRGADGVAEIVPVVSATAFLAGGTGEQLTVHGIDLTNERHLSVYEASERRSGAIDDPLVFLSQPDSIVLTETFAARHALRIDDPVDLETPAGKRRFTVRGLLEPKGVARVYGGNLILMDLLAAEAAFTRPGFVNRIDVVTRPGPTYRRWRARCAPCCRRVSASTRPRSDAWTWGR